MVEIFSLGKNFDEEEYKRRVVRNKRSLYDQMCAVMDGYWYNIDNYKIPIKDMGITHINNVISFLEKRRTWDEDSVEAMISEFRKELVRRDFEGVVGIIINDDFFRPEDFLDAMEHLRNYMPQMADEILDAVKREY